MNKYEQYINKYNELSTESECKEYCRFVMQLFRSDIKDISKGEPWSSSITNERGGCNNYKEFALLIKDKLEQKKYSDIYNLEKLRLETENSKPNIYVTATGGNSTSYATANATATVTITIEQTIKAIADIPSEVLSPDEKEKLQDDLYTLEGIKATKNKDKFWDKAKAVLSFLTDKGADALIAAAPYIIAALQTM